MLLKICKFITINCIIIFSCLSTCNIYAQIRIYSSYYSSCQIFGDYFEETSFSNTSGGRSWREANKSKLGVGSGGKIGLEISFNNNFYIGTSFGYFHNRPTVNIKTVEDFKRTSTFLYHRYPLEIYFGMQREISVIKIGYCIGTFMHFNARIVNKITISDPEFNYLSVLGRKDVDPFNIGISSRIWLMHRLSNKYPFSIRYSFGVSAHEYSANYGNVISLHINEQDVTNSLNRSSRDFVYKENYIDKTDPDHRDPNQASIQYKSFKTVADFNLSLEVLYQFGSSYRLTK